MGGHQAPNPCANDVCLLAHFGRLWLRRHACRGKTTAQKIKGRPLSGWINLHKPLDITSNEAVQAVKRHLKPAKIGHGGTLDPLASGVLPLALGEATKTVSYAMDGAKTYVTKVAFGSATSTDDLEGDVIGESKVRPAEILIKKILHDWGGNP